MANNKYDDILVYALGGICEVGKNCYCIEYKNEIIIIDSGSIFPDKSMKGIDLVIPNFSHLRNKKQNIIGLFITHGHEDHIGSIPYLLREVGENLKIFATGLAATLIKNKCAEHGLTPNIIDYNDKTLIKSKYFQISFFSMVHSIPDAHGVLIKTHLGYIMHTGDFKFDLTPIGNRTNFKKIVRANQSGVLCLLSDSTNSLTNDFSYSEKQISKNIRSIFENCSGRVIVSTFASNIYRVQQIVDASIKCNRKILIFGRSMVKNIEIGDELNYIKAPKNTFIEPSEMHNYPANEITIICTGSQGEALAALSRIAKGIHRDVTIQPTDTVIFSSSAIPGNRESISETINSLYRLGAEVIVNSPLNDIHTTGHASKVEQLLLLNLVNPKYFIPIHGEYHMLKTHARTAVEYGIKEENCFVLDNNGVVVRFNENGAKIAERFYCEGVFIDGSQIFDLDNQILRQRKTLSEHGIVIIVSTISKSTRTLAAKTLIISRGFIYMKTNENIINRIKNISDKIIISELAKEKDTKNINKQKIIVKIQENVSRYIDYTTQRKPIISVKVMIVD